jgi:hypothetical protein
MISSIQWDPIVPLIPLILSGILVLTILTILEWRRKQRFKWIRIACQAIAVFSVVGILLRPAIGSSVADRPVLILTSGFARQQVDSLRRNHPNLVVYRAPGAEELAGAVNVEDFRALRSIRGNPVWVAGWGIPEYALSETPFDFQYLAAGTPDGVIELAYPSHTTAERWSTIDVTYHASKAERTKLVLSGPGGGEDSVNIEASGNTRVTLSIYPKVAGRIVYKLLEKDSSGAVVSSHSLPLSIEKEKKLDILVVNDYPTFEQRYLKNFLAAKGHRVSVRNRVSKDRHHQEFANRERQSLDRLTPALLDNTDLLIIDQGTFQALGNNEKRSIRTSMETGLGVLLLAGEKSGRDQLISFQVNQGTTDTVRFSLGKAGAFTLPAAQIRPAGEITSWLVSKDGRPLTGCQCTGATRTGFQLLRETFQLGLQGNTAAYAAIWTPLLEQTARRTSSEFKVIARTPFPLYSNEPFEFDILSAGSRPTAAFDGVEVPLAEDANIEDVWHGRLYSDGNKWHSITVGTDSTVFDFLDLPGNEWNSLRTARQIHANRLHQHAATEAQPLMVSSQRPFPLVFFILFVLSSGFLWLAPKI